MYGSTHDTEQTKLGRLRILQSLRKTVLLAAILVGVMFMLVGGSTWPGGTLVHETVEWVGTVLIVACILGRTWSALYIAGRKNRHFVTTGPYSISRNPLYVFSIIGAAGIGAQLGSITLALATGVVVWLIFLLVVFKEEDNLLELFGEAYAQYLERVPRFIPNVRLWRGIKTAEIEPAVVVMTFIDASLFLLAIPLAEAVEHLQTIGVLPLLIKVP